MGANTAMRQEACHYRGTFRLIHNGNIQYVRGSITWNCETGQGWLSFADTCPHTDTCFVERPSYAAELGPIFIWSKGHTGTYRTSRRYFTIRFDSDLGGFRSI